MNKDASFLSPDFMVVAFGHFPRRTRNFVKMFFERYFPRQWGGALRDDPNNGCEGDYNNTSFVSSEIMEQRPIVLDHAQLDFSHEP